MGQGQGRGYTRPCPRTVKLTSDFFKILSTCHELPGLWYASRTRPKVPVPTVVDSAMSLIVNRMRSLRTRP